MPAPDLGRVRVDPSQLEQVIMNLAISARDAMPQGGRLTIETKNTPLAAAYARSRPELVPGDYVLMAVSDTGCGMGAEVQSHLFEPFFTTKEKGRGTGLGLATCYGIVKLSGGHIAIYSEPGHGTTVKVYLPRVYDEADIIVRHPESDTLPPGHETILLVEDEPVLRELAALILCECGYLVLETATGEEALQAARAHSGRIHLLMTDVIMPGMGGKQLATQLIETYPDTKILFCSGYTEEAILHHGVLAPGIHFLQKPFTPTSLARKIRSVLDGE